MSKRKECSITTNSLQSLPFRGSLQSSNNILVGGIACRNQLEPPSPTVLQKTATPKDVAKQKQDQKQLENECRKKVSLFGSKLRDDLIKEWNKGKNRDMARVEIYLEVAKVLLTKLNLPLSHNFEAGDEDIEKDPLVAMDILEIGPVSVWQRRRSLVLDTYLNAYVILACRILMCSFMLLDYEFWRRTSNETNAQNQFVSGCCLFHDSELRLISQRQQADALHWDNLYIAR